MAVRIVDLRSDTVTQPTEEMRRAMAEAEVGDDVFGEDPTVNRLQERVAALCGKEAALFVTSGSLGNLVCLKALSQPGDEVICHEGAHFLHYEVASLAAVAGVQARPLGGVRGVLDPDDVAKAVRPLLYTYPRTALVAVENTHNLAGGAVYPLEDLLALAKVAADHGIKLHIDGARIFNASVAAGVDVSEYAAPADGFTFCFSKGLGCPVGSIVTGTWDLIEKARRYRKMFGGGMRQAGVLAAAALVALDTMVGRLADDHANARRLAEGMSALHPECVDLRLVETNMVQVRSEPLGFDPYALAAELAGRGVRTLAYQPGYLRLVTHAGISPEDVEFALDQFGQVLR